MCVDLQLPLQEVCHKQKLQKVTGYKYVLHSCTNKLLLHLKSLSVNHTVYADYDFVATLLATEKYNYTCNKIRV